MNRKAVIIIALQTLLIVLLFWVIVFYGKDEYEEYMREQDEEIESPSYLSQEKGATVVTLSPETQAQSGIESIVLQPSAHQQVVTSFGSVVGIDPLIDLRTRYLSAKSEVEVVRASLANNQQDYQRLLQLNQDNRNVSDRAVASALATVKADEAKIRAAETSASNIRDSMRQLWGETLSGIAVEQPAGDTLRQLVEYKQVLVQVTLPFNVAEPAVNSRLTVSPTGDPDKLIEARLVSRAPASDTTIPGKTYFYRANAANLRAGMRVSVRMPETDKAVTGVIVPASTIIWHGGKAWVYKKQGEDRFLRTLVDTNIEVNEGWFNSGNLRPGDAIVNSGAQLLLSEEFKSQIKNENED